MSADDVVGAAAASGVAEGEPAVNPVEDMLKALLPQPAGVFASAQKEIDILGNIKALREQQKGLRDERKKVTKLLRNEEKRRQRLRKRARQLSDGDLVALLKMRSDSKTEAAPAAVEQPAAAAADA